MVHLGPWRLGQTRHSGLKDGGSGNEACVRGGLEERCEGGLEGYLLGSEEGGLEGKILGSGEGGLEGKLLGSGEGGLEGKLLGSEEERLLGRTKVRLDIPCPTDRIHLGLGTFPAEPEHISCHVSGPASVLLPGQVGIHLVRLVEVPGHGAGREVVHRLAGLDDALKSSVRQELAVVWLRHSRTYV